MNVTRREFLASTGGLAAAFLALNSVFGKFFDVDATELFEPAATQEKFPRKEFIFDIHTHHVAAGKQIRVPPLLRYREVGAAWGNRALEGRAHRWEDLYLATSLNFLIYHAGFRGAPQGTEWETGVFKSTPAVLRLSVKSTFCGARTQSGGAARSGR